MRTKLIAWLILFCGLLTRDLFPQEKEPLWVFPVGAAVQSSPAIGKDGTIYFGADNGIFYALTPQGKKKWEFVTSGMIVSTPAIASDGTIYITSVDKIVYAINPDGSEKWRIMPGSGIVASPSIAPDGTIIVGTVFNKLFSISSDGFRKWEFPTMGNIVSSPAIDCEGTIYFGCLDTNFYAVSTNGAAVWVFTAADKINSSPAIDKDGTLYFGSYDGLVYALAPTGKLRWSFKTGGAVRSSPTIGMDGEIYIGSDDKKLYSIGRDGLRKWDFPTKDWVRSSPAIAADGTIYVGSYDGNLYAINKDGSLKWAFKTQGIVSSSPVIDNNGVLYFGSWDRNFYAIKVDSTLANTPWPCFRKNARRTGCEVDDSMLGTQPKRVVKTEPELIIPPKKIEKEEPQPKTPAVAKEELKLPQPVAEKPKTELVKPEIKPAEPAQTTPPEQVETETPKSASSKPTIKITTPKDGAKLEEQKVVVEGIAKDKKGIKSIQYKFNATRTGIAQGLGKWSVPVILQEGKNIFEARSINIDGNYSDWEKITIYYKPSYQVFAETLGKGRITPIVAGKKFEFGEKVKLKAEPEKNYSFLAWYGSIQATTPEIEFEVRSNILLKAIFIPAEKAVAQVTPESGQKDAKTITKQSKQETVQTKSGTYRALLFSKTGETNTIHGMFMIDVSDDSSWKGVLITTNENIQIEGKFDNNNFLFFGIKRESNPTVGISLKLVSTNNTWVLNGQITGLGGDLIFTGYKQRNDLAKLIKTGFYTAILAIPQKEDDPPVGDGYAKIQINDKGDVSIVGKLFDGSQFTTTSGVDANRSIPIFANTGNGYIAGTLLLTNTAASDITGALIWVKAGKNTGKTDIRALGSYYSPEVGSKFISNTNLIVAFNGGGMESLVPNIVFISNDNKTETKFSEVGLEFSFNFETGTYQGKFMHPVLKKQSGFEGVFLQKAKWGSGFFTCGDKTGIVLVTTDSGEIK